MKLAYLAVIGSWQLFVWWSTGVGLLGTGVGMIVQQKLDEPIIERACAERDEARERVRTITIELEALKLDLFNCQRTIALNDEALTAARNETEEAKKNYATVIGSYEGGDRESLCRLLGSLGIQCR